MAEKPSKADKILDVMDDLSAAVDDFAARLQALERLFDKLNDSLVGIRNTLDTMDERTDQMQGRLSDMDTTLDVVNDQLKDASEMSENLKEIFPDIQDVADDVRRRERQDMLFEARAAMGKVKFISMRA